MVGGWSNKLSAYKSKQRQRNKKDKRSKLNIKVSKKDSFTVNKSSIRFYKNSMLQNSTQPKMMFTYNKFTKRFCVLLMILTKKPENFLMIGILRFIALWRGELISWCRKWTNNWGSIGKPQYRRERKSYNLSGK